MMNGWVDNLLARFRSFARLSIVRCTALVQGALLVSLRHRDPPWKKIFLIIPFS